LEEQWFSRTVEEPQPFKADTHRTWRNQKLLCEWPYGMLHSLTVALVELIECTRYRDYLVLGLHWHQDPILSAKDAWLIITEQVPPSLHHQLTRHQQTRSIEVRLKLHPLFGAARSTNDGRS
jgi:hypothetical protein